MATPADGAGRIAAGALALLAVAASAGAQTAQKAQIDAFVAHSGLSRASVVAVKSEIVVAIRDRDAVRSGLAVQRVRLQGEAVDEPMAERLGYRSMRSSVEINCETRRDRVVEMEVFPQHDLRGPGEKRPVPGGWVQPSEDAFLADVIRAVCRGPSPSVPNLTSPDPAVQGPASPGASGPAPLQTLAEAARLRPAVPAATKLPARATPVVLARPAPPPLEGTARPRLMSLVVAPPPGAPSPASQPSGAVRGPGVFMAQVGALDTEADARRALDRLTLPRGVSARVEAAAVGGRVYYRALVAGFAGPGQAQAFCAEQQRHAQPCLVR